MSFIAALQAEHRLLASVRNRGEIYERAHHAARDIVPLDAFYLCLYEPKNRMLSFEYNGDEEGLDTPERFTLGTGPTSRTILSRKPQVLNHLHDASLAPYTFGGSERRSRGAIHLPFWDGAPGVGGQGSPLGVISVQSYRLDAYDRSHVAAVRWLAARTANLLRETDAQVAREASSIAAEAELRGRLRTKVEALCKEYATSDGFGAAILCLLEDENRQQNLIETNALSDREIQCLALAAQGFSYGRIADILGIGRETVKTHLPRAYSKVGVQNSRSLSAYLPDILRALADRELVNA